ncbi:hypothetical protein ACN47E_002104 [Coniothyrium glycines]
MLLIPVDIVLCLCLLSGYSTAQQFPPPVTYDTILTSPLNPNITISYKQPKPDTCATAFASQKQYSGYVHLPPDTLAPLRQKYPINTFFWFFEARTNPETAPLTIWLNGGPGSSSMIGLFQELGPCEVIQLPNGTYGTQPRLWGWDRSSNMLFIDQPTQTGFSFDERTNASINLVNEDALMPASRKSPQPVPEGIPAWRWSNGTFASYLGSNTQNTTAIAARACWHFLQGFLSAFPQYNPGTHPNSTTVEPTAVHLFTESYGGLYGPTFADYFEDQNDRRMNESISTKALEIRLGSVGIMNGMLDQLVQTVSVVNFTRDNSYNINAIDLVTYQNTISEINSEGGCKALVLRCRKQFDIANPEEHDVDEQTNEYCEKAFKRCSQVSGTIFQQTKKSPYDIRVAPNIGPGAAYQEYLNTADVLASIGAQINFTQNNMAVFEAFSDSGDAVRDTQIRSLAKLLSRGIRVAFLYGDADVICNWYAGQNASLELAHLLPTYNTTFPEAGYADIAVNDFYVGGQVRQYGNLSFSRIYDAGHLVPYHQPETAFTVFTRIIEGDDISMGRNVDLSTFGTQGSPHSSHENKLPPAPASTCWVRDMRSTCTLEQVRAIMYGQGSVKDGIWHSDLESESGQAPPRSASQRSTSLKSAKPNASPTRAVIFTGVFTATSTPKPPNVSSESSRVTPLIRIPRRLLYSFRNMTPSRGRKEHVQRQAIGIPDDLGKPAVPKNLREKKLRRIILGLIGGLVAALAILSWVLVYMLCSRCYDKRHDVNKDMEDVPGAND